MRRRSRLAATVLLCGLLAACGGTVDGDSVSPTAPTPTGASAAPEPTQPPPETTAPPEPTSAEPEVRRIADEQWDRVVATGAWREECPVGQDELRVLAVNFVDFDDAVQRGEIVAHRDTVDSLGRIFEGLFEQRFPIERMEPVEAYDGDTLESLRANNTSAYNCRRPDQINAPVLESPHANGRAIDINPDLNPWMDLRCDCWSPRARHAERTPAPGKILADGPVVELFEDEGWIWQNIDVEDYMHFDTGYPSAPLEGADG